MRWKKSPENNVEKETKVQQPEWKPSLQQWIIIAVLASQAIMVSLDATMVTTSLPIMARDLNASTTQGFWIGSSYLLASSAPMLFIGALSDAFGRPQCLTASIFSFTIGSIICCVAKNIGTMMVGRCIQGVGGGGIIIMTLIVFTDMVPLRFRPKYYGLIQAAWAIGTCLGPLIGGAFAGIPNWRWVFYLMLPFCGIGLVGVPLFVRLQMERRPWKETVAAIDWIGGFLSIAAFTSFLVAISWGGTQYPWSNWRTVVPLVMGIIGVLITVIWERYFAQNPYLRKELFHSPSSCVVYVGSFIQGFLLYGQLYYFSFYLLSVKECSPTRTGVLLLPVTLMVAPAAAIVGRLITRFGKYRWAIWSGWVIITLGSGLTILCNTTIALAPMVIILMVVGLGHGLVLNALNTGAQALCQPGDESHAASMYIFLRSLGMAVGVGIGSTVFQNIMTIKLNNFGLPTDLATNSEAFIETLVQMPTSQQKSEILTSYAYGFDGTFGFFCGLAGLAMILSVIIKHRDFDKDLQSEHTLKQVRWSRTPTQLSTTRIPEEDADALKEQIETIQSTQSPQSPESPEFPNTPETKPPPPHELERTYSDSASSFSSLSSMRNTVLPDVELGPDLSVMISQNEETAVSRWFRKYSSRPPSIRPPERRS